MTQRIVWSPDGTRAAVIGGEGDLYLSDPEGKLSGLLLSNVTAVAWFSDSRRLAIARLETCTNWSRMSALLSADTLENLRSEATNLMARFQSEDPKSILKQDRQSAQRDYFNGLLLYLRDEYAGSNAFRQALKESSDALRDLEVNVCGLFVATTANDKLSTGPALAWDPGVIVNIRIAPGNATIAYASMTDDKEVHLSFVPADGSERARLLERMASFNPDWSPDGKHLVYVKAENANSHNDSIVLGVLTRRRVLNDQGKIDVAEDEQFLAGLMYNHQARVRCLRDGRILFAAEEWRLPATEKDLPQRQQLFALAPEQQSTLTPLIPRGTHEAMPTDLNQFEVSPDEKRIAVGGDKGLVTIFTLASGDVEAVQKNGGTDIKNPPTWRSSTELCYVAIPETNTNNIKPEVVLWRRVTLNGNPGEIKVVLSEKWPEKVRKDLLE